jgi:hypothetical protein
VLKYLANKFGSVGTKIDTCVHNPGREPPPWLREPQRRRQAGAPSPHRPHNLYPPNFEVVPRKKILALAMNDERLYRSKTHRKRKLAIDEEDLRDIIRANQRC